MSYVTTALVGVRSIDIKPIDHRPAYPEIPDSRWMCTQRLTAFMDDGSQIELTLHYEDRCQTLQVGPRFCDGNRVQTSALVEGGAA